VSILPKFEKFLSGEEQIGVIGLGYVGLPLACLLAKKFKVVGFDKHEQRIVELRKGIDRTGEIADLSELKNKNISFVHSGDDLKKCRFIIVAVPTPVDEFKSPDLTPLIKASKTVSSVLTQGTVVVYESTVYPGVTEDICVKEIEKGTTLKYLKDFFVGYSPERVNPGDREHTIEKIIKVVSGCTDEVLDLVSNIYGSVIEAGIHKAKSIKIAEASKVIENIQRDINIALMNELSQLFDRIGIDTLDVLAASGTKWNFLPFKPGLVGGHCIGIDPYYLTTLANKVGFHPDVILAGRRTNDSMGEFVGRKTIELILKNRGLAKGRPIRVGIFGATFKENVPDVRNTKVVDIASYLERVGVEVLLTDPMADSEEFKEEYGRELVSSKLIKDCDAVIVAVAHETYKKELTLEYLKSVLIADSQVALDLKGMFDLKRAKQSGLLVWRM
jgi:UDP-N-acetyl-D-galactosamine dehydrogenase